MLQPFEQWTRVVPFHMPVFTFRWDCKESTAHCALSSCLFFVSLILPLFIYPSLYQAHQDFKVYTIILNIAVWWCSFSLKEDALISQCSQFFSCTRLVSLFHVGHCSNTCSHQGSKLASLGWCFWNVFDLNVLVTCTPSKLGSFCILLPEF